MRSRPQRKPKPILNQKIRDITVQPFNQIYSTDFKNFALVPNILTKFTRPTIFITFIDQKNNIALSIAIFKTKNKACIGFCYCLKHENKPDIDL